MEPLKWIHGGFNQLKGSSQPLLCFCLHPWTWLIKSVDDMSTRNPRSHRDIGRVTAKWFLRRENQSRWVGDNTDYQYYWKDTYVRLKIKGTLRYRNAGATANENVMAEEGLGIEHFAARTPGFTSSPEREDSVLSLSWRLNFSQSSERCSKFPDVFPSYITSRNSSCSIKALVQTG